VPGFIDRGAALYAGARCRNRRPPRAPCPPLAGEAAVSLVVATSDARESLNAPIRGDGDSGEWQDWLIDETANQEAQLADSEETDKRLQALNHPLTVLNPRERRIFEARRLTDDPVTLAELASEYGVSRERVRQIEANAFDRICKETP
jgi:RNA polymerase sigma factor (sigma-70 family)